MNGYDSVVTGLGDLAGEFFAAGIVVLFAEQAPPELREIAVLHAPGTYRGAVQPGQTLYLAEKPYRITAVGEVANRNLRELGHAVIKFNGLTTPELPGDLCVEALPVPVLHPGDAIRIVS